VAWTESGLFYPTMRDLLKGALTSVNWLTTTNKMSLASNSATPDFFGTTDPSTWTSTAEVVSSAGNWTSSGGVAFSALGAGSTSIAPAFSHTGPGPSTLVYSASNVSVATTTITGAFGAYLYAAAQSPAAMYLGIWFGGSGVTTVAGTFAVTWNASGIMTLQCAA
jgi:hypothetical protein